MEAPATQRAGEATRLAAIARIAAAKGWGHLAGKLGFPGHEQPASGPATTDAVRLREALEELGPTFVKFGQMLSQREDLFPKALVSELRSLQDHVATFPAAQARRIVEDEIGNKIEALFASFDDEPMAAASMAQVHRATLPDGTRVIVKVQRPGIADTVEGDIAVLRRLVRLASAALPSLRAFNLPELVEEFTATLRTELTLHTRAHS